MSGLSAKDPRLSNAFCEGVVADQAGAAETANPHLAGTPEELAWDEGHRASTGPLGIWATITAYVLGDMVTADGKVWSCTVAGTSTVTPEDLTAQTVPEGWKIDTGGAPQWQLQGVGAVVDLGCCGVNRAGPPYIPSWA